MIIIFKGGIVKVVLLFLRAKLVEKRIPNLKQYLIEKFHHFLNREKKISNEVFQEKIGSLILWVFFQYIAFKNAGQSFSILSM